MSIKGALDFSILLVGDGTDANYVISTATGPFGLRAPDTIHGASELSPALSLGSLVPNGVIGVVSANGHSVSASIAFGVLTITYATGDVPAAGEMDTVQGYFTFAG